MSVSPEKFRGDEGFPHRYLAQGGHSECLRAALQVYPCGRDSLSSGFFSTFPDDPVPGHPLSHVGRPGVHPRRRDQLPLEHHVGFHYSQARKQGCRIRRIRPHRNCGSRIERDLHVVFHRKGRPSLSSLQDWGRLFRVPVEFSGETILAVSRATRT